MVLPPLLATHAQQVYQQLIAAQPSIASWQAQLTSSLIQVLGLSDFMQQVLLKDTQLCQEFPYWAQDKERQSRYRRLLKERMAQVTNENQALAILRQFRNQELFYIAWRDFLHTWSLEESLLHLSELAEAIIIEAYQWLYQTACQEWGQPCDENGIAQPMLIIAMGKLGGKELNFSSDIDLIFSYPENGETQGARRPLSNAQFFTRLAQRLIKLLDHNTTEGFCYRVDMRLRPFGDSGPLVMSYAALEDYYQEQGRDWERYAMIKGRILGTEQQTYDQALAQMLRPFVYRRYIDFSVVQSLRRMKSMIISEVRRQGLVNNIKLGSGGIREIEFIAQTFQLIRGGREPSLRQHGLLTTLEAIAQLGLLSAQETEQLTAAYCFFRRLENYLQAQEDKQTQTLPDGELARLKLAVAMQYPDWSALYLALTEHQQRVHTIFKAKVGDDDEDSEDSGVETCYQELWDFSTDPAMLTSVLTQCSASNVEAALNVLMDFKTNLTKSSIGPRGREVLNRLMPKVYQAIFTHPEAQFGLPRVLALLNNIASRTTYLELLDEHPAALTQLVKLCTASPMISEQLTRHPILLDELIDPSRLYNPLSVAEYKTELVEFLARIPEDDMEQQMEAVRQFKQICMLKIAAADVTGALPVMKVSDHLTYLAEAIMEAVVHQAWRQTTAKYGQPRHLAERDDKGFGVIGYGKLGGWELGYQSDLDVVFVHDSPENSVTEGEKSIDSHQFYLRLALRIAHIFSARTASGVLYELDTRLRPDGESGLMASSFTAFEEYQRQKAWTWEHQALVRARLIYGSNAFASAFTHLRYQVLTASREAIQLQQEVLNMRQKMYPYFGHKAGRFKLKEDVGGITDIEFIAQYLVLRYSAQYPKLTLWSDNVRIFELLAQQGIMPYEQAEALTQAYISMRNQAHRRHLLNLSVDVADDKLQQERQRVQSSWDYWFSTPH